MFSLLPDVILKKINSSLKIKDKYHFLQLTKDINLLLGIRFKKKYFPKIDIIKTHFDNKIISLLGGILTVLEYPICKFDCRLSDINYEDLPESIILGITNYSWRFTGQSFIILKIVQNWTQNYHTNFKLNKSCEQVAFFQASHSSSKRKCDLLFLETEQEIIYNNVNDIEGEVLGKIWKFYKYEKGDSYCLRVQKFPDLAILPKLIRNEIVEMEEDTYIYIL